MCPLPVQSLITLFRLRVGSFVSTENGTAFHSLLSIMSLYGNLETHMCQAERDVVNGKERTMHRSFVQITYSDI